MALVLIVLVGAVVVAIALVAVGRVVGELGDRPRSAVFDLDQAVSHVADQLPFEVTAQLGYDDVRRLLGWQVDYLTANGVAVDVESDDDAVPAEELVVIDQADLRSVLVARAGERGCDYTESQVTAVVAAGMDYLSAIGALGAAASPPEEPPGS